MNNTFYLFLLGYPQEGNLNGILKSKVAYSQVLNKYPALSEANPSEALVNKPGMS
jgi:hypothetical protein